MELRAERVDVEACSQVQFVPASKQGWGSGRDRDFLRAFLVVILGTIYATTDRVFLHEFRIKWPEAIGNSLRIRNSGIEPAIVVFFPEYGWHPVGDL